MAPTPRRDSPVALTGQAEDYLKVMYHLERSGAAAATSDIAAELGVAPASVSGMLQRLARLGLVRVERYRGARLAPPGRRIALQLIRRHRIIESFLATTLGYSWDDVHAEAERLEHAASTELVERMAASLGHPTTDPHGAPIPTPEGRVNERLLRSIAELRLNERARVVLMRDRDPAFLRYLAGVGLRPGVEITVVAIAPFDGPVELRVSRKRVSIGASAAGRVFVESV